MRKILALLFLVSIFSCKNSEQVLPQEKKAEANIPAKKENRKKQPQYQAAKPLVWNLIHTRLDLGFDFEKETVIGEAVLTLSPHFYNQSTLLLHAKAFNIESVRLLDDSLNTSSYEYDGEKLTILFSNLLTKKDTVNILIKYVANPNEVEERSGKAIRGGQGLYFINAQKTQAEKPTQIWTQGETDFSSCWFPTLDEPNQKMTQEIAVTVPDNYKTLSNGTLEFSTENGNGTRTDIWAQNKPHSPYLVMLAVGDFAVYEDTWRNLSVDYYTEPDYHDDAPHIFGETPAMMEFYSKLLGVDYPWDKYAQVVVRDFVSGAMENTSATIHGEFVQRHKRELIDYPQEGIIAHELFHQWFGNLVSCESWSNITLNEAFATYGEYLWVEHSKTPFEAQFNLEQKLRSYLRESERKQVDFVRFQYDSKIEVFDGHSYSKGACILHQLRTVVGDDAFFESLKTYLSRFAHKSAEMHDLRLIVEEVTGRDMNWFFNQWMFDKGHPKLTITYNQDSATLVNYIVVQQNQNLDEFPLYQIPLVITSYQPYAIFSDTIRIQNEIDTFYLKGSASNLWVDFDTDNYLLAEVEEPNKTVEAWYNQYSANTNYRDVSKALTQLLEKHSSHELTKKAVHSALKHPFDQIRVQAIHGFVANNSTNKPRLKQQLIPMIKSDLSSTVRARAFEIYRLNDLPDDKASFYTAVGKDESYKVLETAIKTGVEAKDTTEVLKLCSDHETDQNEELILAISKAYSTFGSIDQIAFFKKNLNKIGAYKKANFLYNYSEFVIRHDVTSLLIDSYSTFKTELLNSRSNWIKYSASKSLVDFYKSAKEDVELKEKQIQQTETATAEQTAMLEEYQMRLDAINANIEEVLKKETNQVVIDRLSER